MASKEQIPVTKPEPGGWDLLFPPEIWGKIVQMREAVLMEEELEHGKLERPSKIEAMEDGHGESCGLIISDRKNGHRFLVDTGADVSVLPATMVRKRSAPDEYKLYAANGTEIPTYGQKTITANLGLRRAFTWKFIVAQVKQPIIGADFLKRYGLLVDLRNRRLIDTTTSLTSEGQIKKIKHSTISTVSKNNQYHNILRSFTEITQPAYEDTTPTITVQHRIQTTGNPVAERARRLTPEKLKAARAEIEDLRRQGICSPSSSEWASPIHLVPKKTGEWRLCGDYRKLNDQTIPDRYPIPHLQDFSYKLHGAKIFSTIDLTKAYFQVPVAPEDRKKTAVITPFGLYEFNRMPFGLTNAAQTFQRAMDQILRGLDFAHCYIDDILIASQNERQHEQHLRQLFQLLKQHKITINTTKCVFGAQEVQYLGYLIDEQGARPLTEKVKAIMHYAKPRNVSELRRFLGIINFYRRFIKNAATIQAPLHKYLEGAKKKDRTPIAWTTEAETAFEECKTSISNATLLAHPAENSELTLTTDASDMAMGAVLHQLEKGSWRPIGFYSKKFTIQQQRYSTYDRELTAIYNAIKFFRHMLEGRNFRIQTDHRPLTYALKQKPDKASPRQLRQLDYIGQFTTDIQYIQGKKNEIADALSRLDVINLPTVIDATELQTEQNTDIELKHLLRSTTALQLQKRAIDDTDIQVYCDVKTGRIRPYIPQKLRRRLFNNFHNLAHTSGRATKKHMRDKFVWPSMSKDIAEWTRNCIQCQRSKINKHGKTIPEQIPVPPDRFKHIHLDIVGPLPEVRGKKYLLTMMDRSTRWPEAIPLKEADTDTIAIEFLMHWVARFGAPETITTDRGTQFESLLFNKITQLLGCNRIRTTAYHPASNGILERWHRSLKAAIMCHESNWLNVLPNVLLGLRTSLKEDIGATAAEMLYGINLRIPGEFLDTFNTNTSDYTIDKYRNYMQQVKPKATVHHTKKRHFILKDLQTCSHVFVRVDLAKKALEQPYEGPYPVVERQDKYFTIKMKGQQQNIAIDRLKPAYVEKSEETEIPIRTYARSRSSAHIGVIDSEGGDVAPLACSRLGKRHVHFGA